jgi:hypothetical protein
MVDQALRFWDSRIDKSSSESWTPFNFWESDRLWRTHRRCGTWKPSVWVRSPYTLHWDRCASRTNYRTDAKGCSIRVSKRASSESSSSGSGSEKMMRVFEVTNFAWRR